ncbi:phage antirepressor KilAC domain-containing protein [Clostridioides difficile]|uniref:phage antirepressor n=1 Tax=Clostridioides difficile TaxID=1496 RepID=UPI00097FF9FD|nr:phage antirepressor KilAC domain-containing protein [Clostridioides difficile]EKS6837332.1 phage antirepressor KilAC domain-containing protein [Clostridioides difficile]MBY1351094.1 phage antirepressor KilAC domain-containing protein [Clostridioides difficile]MCE4816040.1 phage antirepressor KilAC domain-containing protein [Clostridioides difficile]MCJ0276702.1 phage antirepressor KilAC domain-containing protein [Clostridioides difficile]MCJ0339113.1 phage antirepressor KilAC domain-contain
MNNLQTIKEQELLGKEFKVYGTLENPLFLARDVAEWIDYSKTSEGYYNTSKMLMSIDEDEKVTITNSNSGGNKLFLTEDGLYEVLMQSRKQIAKQFKKEVKKILKEIRKTGGYIHSTNDMSDDEIMARALQVAQKKIESKNRELEEKNRFINQIASSKNSLLVREVAKVISKSNGIIIGEKRLYEKLRVWGLVFKNSTEPKQFAVEKGYLETVEGTRETSTGVFTYRTTRVTGKGQEYILKRLLKEEEEQISMLG